MEVADDGRISPSGNLDLSRDRSNSDPGRREKTVVMNGGNTVPTRRAPTFLNATEVGVSSSVAGANSTPSTPPTVRRSKLAVSIGRLFRPWKWRRRKKSQKFITTSQSEKFWLLVTVILWQICSRLEFIPLRSQDLILSFFANTPSTSTWIDLYSVWLFSFYWHKTITNKKCEWKHKFTSHPFDMSLPSTVGNARWFLSSFFHCKQLFLFAIH